MLSKFFKYSILSSVIVITIPLAAVLPNNSISVITETNNLNLEPSDFISQPVKNSQIYNEGGSNYQYQSILSPAEVNDPNTFNRNNVLSTKSIQTVRSEKYYFNFIKAPEATTYHIMVTPVDPSSLIDPIKVDTEYTEMNGSALWIKDHLVIIGSKGTNVFLTTYTQNMETGELTLKDSILASASEHVSLFNLQDERLPASRMKLIDNWPGIPSSATTSEMVPYYTYTRPIYLSPVEDFSNPESANFSVVAWVGDYTLTQLTTNNKTPVLISFDVNNGVTISQNWSFSLPSNDIDMPKRFNFTFPRNAVLNSKLLALSAMKNENNELIIYPYFFGTTAHPNNQGPWINSAFVAQSSIDPNYAWNIDKFSDNSIDVTSSFVEIHVQRDPMNYIPYGMFAKGEFNSKTNKNNINLFLFVTPDLSHISSGVVTNVIIDSNSNLSTPREQQIRFYQQFGIINSEYFFAEQIYYPPERDLEKGIHVGVRYRGVAGESRITKIGTLKWQTPWNPDTWSQDAAWYGTTIINGYAASVESISADATTVENIFVPDIIPTVWNGVYNAPGIYEGQTKPNTPGALPTLPEQREGAVTLTRNLATSLNTFETVIPRNITISAQESLEPNIIGNSGIQDFIKDYSKDFPNTSSKIEIAQLNFVEDQYLSVIGKLLNPYINGTQALNKSIPINLKIQHPPSNGEILNPVKINNNNVKLQLPSTILVLINEAFSTPGVPIEVDGIIGLSNNDLIQIIPSMAPYFSSFKASSNDFLGSLKLEYEIQSANGKIIQQEIIVNGFWGNVYIIVIILGSIILTVGITLLILLLLKKKHKTDLTSSFSSGFNLQKLNQSKFPKTIIQKNSKIQPPSSVPSNKIASKSLMTPPLNNPPPKPILKPPVKKV